MWEMHTNWIRNRMSSSKLHFIFFFPSKSQMLLSSPKRKEGENFTLAEQVWEIPPTVFSLGDNQLSSAFSTHCCLSWAPSWTFDIFILQQGLDTHCCTLAKDYFGQMMIKRIFLAGFCRQNVRGFVSESEIEVLFRVSGALPAILQCGVTEFNVLGW